MWSCEVFMWEVSIAIWNFIIIVALLITSLPPMCHNYKIINTFPTKYLYRTDGPGVPSLYM